MSVSSTRKERQFNNCVSSTQKTVSSTQKKNCHFNIPVSSTKRTVSSTHPSAQHKKSSVQHTRQLNTKNRHFNILVMTAVSSTQKTSVQYTRQFNTKKELFLLNWGICVELMCWNYGCVELRGTHKKSLILKYEFIRSSE